MSSIVEQRPPDDTPGGEPEPTPEEAITGFWAAAKARYLASDFPAYASSEWRDLDPDDPRKFAGVLWAAEQWRFFGDDIADELNDALKPKDPLYTRKTLAELNEAAKPKPPHQLQATPGWPPIAVPGKPGRHLVHRQEKAA